jgi:two-component system, NtrC family, sensor histidine kinase HydH
MEATLNNVIALHTQGIDAVEPLHHQLLLDLAEVDRYANKPRERELVRELRGGFDEYLRLWRSKGPKQELVFFLRTHPLAVVQALRRYNEDEERASEEGHLRSVRRMSWGLVAVAGLGSVAGMVLGYGVARSLRRSVQQLLIRVQGATELLSQQIPAVQVEGVGEPLWDGANDLVARVEEAVRRLNDREREVRRADRMAAVGQLAAGVAHEVRNPLTSAILLLETARKDPAAGLTAEDLDLIGQELHRIESILQTFLSYARPPKLERTECDLVTVVQDALAVARGRIGQANVAVTVNAPGPCRLVADPAQLGQVALNLILNAVDAMPAGGHLSFDFGSDPSNGTIRLTVRDTGYGIAAEILPRLFEPFVTGKETGTGLGLVVSKRLIEDHGGTIEGYNPPDGGACFVIRLPGPSAQTPPTG